jgi:hypothetical protein
MTNNSASNKTPILSVAEVYDKEQVRLIDPYNMTKFVEHFPHLKDQPNLSVAKEDWIAYRARGIGASEIASAANVNGAYLSRMALYDLKTHPRVEISNPALEYGTEHEPYARKAFLDLFSPLFEEIFHPTLLEADFDSCFFCSPDDVVIYNGVPFLVEYKCPYSKMIYPEVPDHHYAQLVTNMRILRAHAAFYVVWTPDEMRVWFVKYSYGSFMLLYDSATVFWDKYLAKGKRPPRTKKGCKITNLQAEEGPYPTMNISLPPPGHDPKEHFLRGFEPVKEFVERAYQELSKSFTVFPKCTLGIDWEKLDPSEEDSE